MAVKCCGTCRSSDYLSDISLWCYLVDDPVKFEECCDSWSKE